MVSLGILGRPPGRYEVAAYHHKTLTNIWAT